MYPQNAAIGGGGGAYSTTSTDPRATAGDPAAQPAQRAVSDIDDNLSTLHDRISRLEGRLECVCTPQPPEKDQTGIPATPGSLMTQILQRQGFAVSHATSRLEKLLTRLEL